MPKPAASKTAKAPQLRKRRYMIAVTEADIASAIPKDSSVCALARAIARTLPDTRRISVDTQAIRFSRGPRRFIYLTPPIAQKYVVDFDAGREIAPFEFRLHEDAMLPVKQQTLTDTGRAIHREEGKAARAAMRKAKATGKDPVQARNAARRAARLEARTRHPGLDRTVLPGRRPAPQVFRTKQRSYGHRLLRINQANAAILDTADTSDPEAR